ncbi:hypothetical protein DCAR_0314367 [Daucus carota subsp. sativus]|uniref:G domain-containing protein n=1 Tax=Daucus carota subsp. sativus TaxID=79200 RepID=A0AAF0WVR5_DAUCS|nr:PREDICTED: uncharacterized protein LOC108211306 isoform X2 [Daucus carota subsp. sativus]WOG95065.1 hypothetical protein DCAR_0314367 [Daucus carota subsp. sativus]
MGGDTTISPPLSSSDEESLLEQELQDYPFEPSASLRRDNLSLKGDDGSVRAEKGLMLKKFNDVGIQVSRDSLYFTAKQKQAHHAYIYSEVLWSYDELQCRTKSLEAAKLRILRYKPGTWTEKVGGMELRDYIVPKTATLLLVGPERSGKSSLVNRILRAFDDDKFSPERAQVSYNCNDGDGTYFLQENMVLRGSSSFCLYDTRSLSDNESENTDILNQWMTEGVRHGELVIRNSDGPELRNKLNCKSHQNLHCSSKTRTVNFVIFVVSGLSVLNCMDNGDEDDGYNKMIATMFKCPFLSFKDDKPVVVVTHGDLLSLSDRARVRVHLGELLGVHPKKQIFDIPEDCDPATDLTIIELLRYSLEHADRNLPNKARSIGKIHKVWQPISLIMVLILGIAIISALVHNAYVCNGHKLHAPHTNAPIGRNANNASKADSLGIKTVHTPEADAATGTGWTAENFSLVNPSDMDTKHGCRTKSSYLPQKEATASPSTNDVPTKDAPTGRNADNLPQAVDPSGMNIMLEHKRKSARLPPKETTIDVPAKDAPGRNADNSPQADNHAGMKRKLERRTKSSHSTQKGATVYSSKTVSSSLPEESAQEDWNRFRLWLDLD